MNTLIEEPLIWEKKTIEFVDNTICRLWQNTDTNSDQKQVFPYSPKFQIQGAKSSFHIDLVLDSQPRSKAKSVYPNIARGLLRLTVNIRFNTEILTRLSRVLNSEIRSLFINEVKYIFLEKSKENELLIKEIQGAIGTGEVSTIIHLNKKQAQYLIDILERRDSPLYVRTELKYNPKATRKFINLKGNWLEIYNYIKINFVDKNEFTEEEYLIMLENLFNNDKIEIIVDEGSIQKIEFKDCERILKRLFTVIFQKEYIEGVSPIYKLMNPPSPYRDLDYSQIITTYNYDTFTVENKLEDLFESEVDSLVWNEHISLFVDDPNSISGVATIKDVKNFQKVDKSRSSRMVLEKNSMLNLNSALSPSKNHPLAKLNLSANAFKIPYATFANLKLDLNKDSGPQNLPIVDNKDAVFWKDRISNSLQWYAPQFSVINPSISQGYDNSPFKFSLRHIGITETGRKALTATLSFSLELKASDALESAKRKGTVTNPKMIKFKDYSVWIDVPFIDSSSGRQEIHKLNAQVNKDGNVLKCKVEVMDDFVRLVYSVLSLRNSGLNPISVYLRYTFDSYEEVTKNNLSLLFGAKKVASPLKLLANKELSFGLQKRFDTRSRTYASTGEQITLKANRIPRSNTTLTKPLLQLSKPVALVKPVTALPIHVKPQILPHSNVISKALKKHYLEKQQMVTERADLFFDCSSYGHLYVEEKPDDNNVVIGCTEAYRLGEINFKLYEEVSELENPNYYRVYKSLSQPNKFLIVPNLFIISRGFPGDEQAYQPKIYITSVLDVDNSVNNIIQLHCSLEPNIPLYVREELMKRLKELSQNPEIIYPTDTSDSLDFVNFIVSKDVVLSGGINYAFSIAPFLNLSMEAGIASWQLLKEQIEKPYGIQGQIRFNFSDGSSVNSSVVISLNKIGGPWITGPLSITDQGQSFKVMNEIESEVILLGFNNSASPELSFDYPQVLESMSEITVDKINTGFTPIYEIPAGQTASLEEYRASIEDLFVEIVILNLTHLNENGIANLEIRLVLKGSNNIKTVIISDRPEESSAKVEFILPLTEYIASKEVEYTITKNFLDGGIEKLDTRILNLSQQLSIAINNDSLELST